MSPDEFWRSTPRITSLYVAGYLRRRAWQAWHAGAPGTLKDVTFDHLMGRKPQGKAMEPDAMLATVRRIKKQLEKQWSEADGN